MGERHKLLHFSEKPLRGVHSVAQGGRAGAYKPCGLWVSVEGGKSFGWRAWCEAESHRVDRLACATEIVLSDAARVKWIKRATDLDAFTDEYELRSGPSYLRYAREPHWHRVADDFQGIIIAPYLWSRRLHNRTGWYYSWDCASGCIWDATAIADLRPTSPPEGT